MTNNIVTDEQLGVLARRQNDLFRRVREGSLPVESVLTRLQSLIEGQFDAIPVGVRRLIDCDATPYVPEGLKIESHVKGGQIEFDAAKIALHLEPGQKTGTIKGHELHKALMGKAAMNACVLDHLMANTNLIPEEWKQDEQGHTRYIYFWNTVYCDAGGGLYVRCLYWDEGQWDWGYGALDGEFDGQNPAALRAS